MPYDKISDLPEAQVDQYSHHQREAFLEAFNSALQQYGEESRAFAVAHAAAKRTQKEDPTPGDRILGRPRGALLPRQLSTEFGPKSAVSSSPVAG